MDAPWWNAPPIRVVALEEDYVIGCDCYADTTEVHFSDYGLPDLNDPATVGCLLELVREAWERILHTTRDQHGWWVEDIAKPTAQPTESHALVAALEAHDATTTLEDTNG